jgi:O-antigen/teichoic acid export membrane protein
MNPKLFKDISASTIQITVNQVLSLVVFLLTSLYLPKDTYGEFNWSLAVLTFITTVLSLRLEQIVVRKAAALQDASSILTLFMLHVLLTGIGFYLLLLLFSFLFPSFFGVHYMLLLLAISQLFNFFASPFKQVANGKERFGYLAVMSSTANLLRSIGLFVAIVFYQLSIQWVLGIFIVSSLVELAISFFIVTRLMKVSLTSKVDFRDYKILILESLPQLGSAVLMAGINRVDWILLGLFSTASITAEYSFAYRVYELSPFPLLIIAPIILSRFSRFFAAHSEDSLLKRKKELSLLIRLEMIAATLIPLILNIIWTPLIDGITDSKYGAVNQFTFFILSVCIPFQYIINILWSAHFALNRLKLIFRITIITFCIILIGDLVFIPLYNARGAAIVYLTAIIIEYFNYLRSSKLSGIKETWQSLLICLFAAIGSGLASFYFFEEMFMRLAFALALFFLIVLATRQLRISDIRYVFQPVIQGKRNSDQNK